MGGCTKASFPSESVPQAIEKICKDLYKLDVVAEVSGKTIGVLFYTDHLVDDTGMMDQKLIRKTIGDLVLTITRVALSTDLDVRSVVVAIRGQQDFNEIRIIRNMDDIKKAQTEALSMDESLNRTLWEQSKYHTDALDPDYFPLKDLTLESFLAKQVVQRVRFAAPKPAEGASPLPTELVDGRFIDPTEAKPGDPAERVFEFSIVSFESVQPEINVLRFLKVANQVLKGYEFTDFDRIEIKDLLSRKMLLVDRETLTQYQRKKLSDDDVLRLGFKDDVSESERLRNALEIFGFNFQ